jgi:hypothetical protein
VCSENGSTLAEAQYRTLIAVPAHFELKTHQIENEDDDEYEKD